jgi:predicted ATP-dependent serine protease
MTAPLQPRTTTPDEHTLEWLQNDEPLRTERVLMSSVAPLDRVVGGFRSSTSYLIDSDSKYASDILHLTCLQALVEFAEEVVWIDGGNAVKPYAISAMCKRSGFDAHEMLSMVNIARAFTAYQLVSLIDEMLDDEAGRSVPAMIIVSSISDMFMDKDLRRSEAHQLLRRCAERIEEVTRSREAITLVTSHTPGHIPPEPRTMSLLSSVFDLVVQVRDRDDAIDIRVPGKKRATRFTPVPWNQTILNDFDGGFDGEDSAHIPPRT